MPPTSPILPPATLPRLDLNAVTTLMRDLSRLTDPQAAAIMYGQGLVDLHMVPDGGYISLSRRNLERPKVRITRSHTWPEDINPWTQQHLLPILDRGLFSELIYANKPTIIENLPAHLAPDDPAAPYLADMQTLIALPHFDGGEALNMGILLTDANTPAPLDRVPLMLFVANLWGRATHNLVTRQKLEVALASLDAELRRVADIQRSLLPPKNPQIPGLQIATHYQTSQRAGGDYYDFFPLPDDQWGLFVADVSGHGTPAAVIMAITHAIAHTRPGHPMPPDDLLAYLNRTLANRYTTGNSAFVTAFYAIFNPHDRSLAYASAGHPYPRLIRGKQVLELDGETSLPLGILPAEPYLRHRIQLQANDRLLLYTDGIPESFNPAGDAFGDNRLNQACLPPTPDPQALITQILQAVGAFTQNAPPTDDRTLVALTIQ